MQTTSERWKKIVEHHLAVDADKVQPGVSFLDDLGADSLDAVELLMTAEEEFGIEITDAEAAECHTFGDSVRLIEAKVAATS